MTDRLTRAATLRNPVLQTVRNTVLSVAGRLSPVRRRVAMNLSELSIDPARRAGSPGQVGRVAAEPSTRQ